MACGPWHSMPLAPQMHPGEFNHMPCMGAKMTGGIHYSLEKIKHFPVQSRGNSSVKCIRHWCMPCFEVELFALINKSGYV